MLRLFVEYVFFSFVISAIAICADSQVSLIGFFVARHYSVIENGLSTVAAPLWFIMAMISMYCVLLYIERLPFNEIHKCLLCLGFVGVESFLPQMVLPWSIENVFIFAFFFYIGNIVSKYRTKYLVSSPYFVVCFLALVLLYFLLLLFSGSINYSCSIFGNSVFLTILLACLGFVIILLLCNISFIKNCRYLSFLGRHSLSIFLIHLPFYILSIRFLLPSVSLPDYYGVPSFLICMVLTFIVAPFLDSISNRITTILLRTIV